MTGLGAFRATMLVAVVALFLPACPERQPQKSPDSPPASGEPDGESSPGSAPEEEPSRGDDAFDERAEERAAFVQRTIADRGVADSRVLDAMRTVPRHRFVPDGARAAAYTDRPLSIPGGQTISQPYIVAFMTEAAQVTPRSKCLEIGTGSGYQAAVLAEICDEVYSIEYLKEVAEFGKKNLREVGYGPDRVRLRVGDGYQGWPSEAPFDAILVTAAPETVPAPLLEQLAVGGRLVIPVGSEHGPQVLERWTREKKGAGGDAFEREKLMGVRFVPFLGDSVEDE